MSEGEEANDSQQSNKEINSIAENLTDSNTNKSLLVHINSNSGSLIVDNELAKDQPDPDNIKMFVGQIPKSWDELQLRKMFEQYGRVHTLNVLRDKVTSMSRGCCFVTYYTRKAALKAQDALHNIKTLEGVSTQVAATEKAANSIYKDGKADYSNKQVGEKIGVSEEWGRLKKRWTNLVEKYKRIKEPPTGTGSEGVDIPTTWPHFERMHIFCSRRHNINPPLLINSEQVLVSQSASQPASQSTSQPISDSEPSAPLARRQKIRMDDDLKASFLKTDKEVRKAAKYLSKFKKNQFNISSSSDSD